MHHDDFEECHGQNPIGHGSYGSVHKVKEIKTGHIFAKKVFNSDLNCLDSFENEIQIIEKVKYPTLL